MADPISAPAATTAAAATTTTQTGEVSVFQNLLKEKFKTKNDEAQKAVTDAVSTLAEQALGNTKLVDGDAFDTIQRIIAELDKKLSAQLNVIMHHDSFKKLEGTWRGLHHLVSKTETDEKLKIRVMNLSKKDLGRTLKKYKDTAFDQSPLFKKIYEEEFGAPGGTPYGCLLGDYEFSHLQPDVDILEGMGRIAAAAHAPFITAAAPALLNMETWQELSDPRDLTKIFQTPEYAPWRDLRESDNARYLGLTMPRFLSRLPYHPEKNPIDEFAFREDAEGPDHTKYVWSNAAYAMGTNITRAFKLHNWCSRIRGVESGGMVESLPCHTFPTDDGKQDMKCPTEIAIADRREAELAKNGLMPLSHWKNTNYAVFIGAQSLQAPQQYENPDATRNAQLAARLPYLFATCRFAHYLKCIVRDKIGSYKSREDMERWLNEWIMRYVSSDSTASEQVKSEFPLADAKVVVEDVANNPGYYTSKFYLRPHFQLEGLTVSLRLVSKLPTKEER